VSVALLGMSQQALAHIEYYDLNQGAQISDLTAAGKTASTAQYGANPGVTGLPSLNATSDRPLNTTTQWNASNQTYSNGLATFSNAAIDTSTAGFTGNQFYSANTVNVYDVTDWGWGGGTWGTTSHITPTTPGGGLLQNSHEVDFFNFRLDQSSTVTITWNVDDGVGDFIDNGFTLYSGVASYQAHDNALDPLNPTTGLGANQQKIQDPLDTGSVTDAQGIASAFRDTKNNTTSYGGQFNALANWGDSNAAGNWSNVAYVASAHGALANTNGTGTSLNASDTLETLTITLAAGNYIIGASGALGSSFGNAGTFALSNLHGVLTFNAAPVPLPGAAWLFMTAMFGMLGLNRRKSLMV
jgi:hypothetical protein